MMTFSKFGRRVKQNGSNGTNHDIANNIFLIGKKLTPVIFYDDVLNLMNLIRDDLVYEIDFRRIYASIFEGWLETDASAVLRGNFRKLGIV